MVKFGRVDISASDSMKALALELGATDIPSIVVFPTVKSASKKENWVYCTKVTTIAQILLALLPS